MGKKHVAKSERPTGNAAAASSRAEGGTKSLASDAPIREQAAAPGFPAGSGFQTLSVFILALVARGIFFLEMSRTTIYEVLLCDSWQYDKWAQGIAAGEWVGTEVFYQTPLYPYLLGVVYALVGHQVWAIRILQAILGGLACVFLARATSRFFSERIGWIAGIVLALYPPAIFFDGILQKASLDLVLMCGLLWVVSPSPRGFGKWQVIGAGLLLGAFILNRENALVLFPILLAWVAWTSWSADWTTRIVRSLSYCAAIGVVLLPVGARNWYVGGEFLLTTSQLGPNFFIGNHHGASGCYTSLRPLRGDPRHERDDARMLAEEGSGKRLSPSEVSQYWMSRSKEFMREHPVEWLRLLVYKWFLTWQRLEVIDAEGIRIHQHYSWLLSGLDWLLHFGIVVPLGALGIWFTRQRWRELWVLYALMFTFAAAVALFYVFARYRYPLIPIAVMFAAAGAAGLWDRCRNWGPNSKFEVLVGLALAIPLAVVCNWPMSQMNNDEVTYVNVGTALLDENRPADAIEFFEIAARIKPSFSGTYNSLGQASLSLGKYEDAQRYFQKSIDLDPKFAMGYSNLGIALQNQNRNDEAEALFRKSIEIDPLYVPAIRALGRVEMLRGNVEAGTKYLQRAQQLEPNAGDTRADLGLALLMQNRGAEGVAELKEALKINPNLVTVANNLAWLLATATDDSLRDGAEAVRYAEAMCNLEKRQNPGSLDTLAAAYAELGHFDKAIATLDEALKLATQPHQQPLVEEIKGHRQLFEQQQPIRDSSMLTLPPKAPEKAPEKT